MKHWLLCTSWMGCNQDWVAQGKFWEQHLACGMQAGFVGSLSRSKTVKWRSLHILNGKNCGNWIIHSKSLEQYIPYHRHLRDIFKNKTNVRLLVLGDTHLHSLSPFKNIFFFFFKIIFTLTLWSIDSSIAKIEAEAWWSSVT